jgi:hypothetical protein
MARKNGSVFVFAALIFQLSPAWAAAGEAPARWIEPVAPEAARLVLRNLGSRSAEASLGAETFVLAPRGTVEVPAVAGEIRSEASLLVLQVSDAFDAASLEVGTLPTEGARPALEKGAPRSALPAWASALTGTEPIRHGARDAIDLAANDPRARAEIVLRFLAPHTLVRIRQLDDRGREVTSLRVSAARPVLWRATLEAVSGKSRIEVMTLRGEAQGTAAAVGEEGAGVERFPLRLPVKSGGGIALYSPTINWQGSPNLYYNITGAPASLCGDLHVSRNGLAYTTTPNWVCTDASGNASKGPWTYASQSGDEDAYAYIVWSNGLSTNTDHHIWDKTAPIASIGSTGGSPAPSGLSGTAWDSTWMGPQWGAGFSAAFPASAGGSHSACNLYFFDKNLTKYWCSGLSYNSATACTPACTISGMPALTVSWSAGSAVLPPEAAHTSGHCFEWGVLITDNVLLGQQRAFSYTFCAP